MLSTRTLDAWQYEVWKGHFPDELSRMQKHGNATRLNGMLKDLIGLVWDRPTWEKACRNCALKNVYGNDFKALASEYLFLLKFREDINKHNTQRLRQHMPGTMEYDARLEREKIQSEQADWLRENLSGDLTAEDVDDWIEGTIEPEWRQKIVDLLSQRAEEKETERWLTEIQSQTEG